MHFTGYVFQALTKNDRVLTFCNIVCCMEFEKNYDKQNDRRSAVKAQREKATQA
jgi:hypothetical protein